MTQQNRATIKAYFEDGDVPTEAQYIDAWDSVFFPLDDTELDIDANSIKFETSPTGVESVDAGQLAWDEDNGTLKLGLDATGVVLQLGQESHIVVRNSSGSTITNGQLVYISGATGNRPNISLAKADAGSTSQLVAVATHDIANNQDGYVTAFGVVNGIDTSGCSAGDEIFLSATTAGDFTNTAPTSPNIVVKVGTCLTSNPATGKIQVDIGTPLDADNTLSGDSDEIGVTQKAVKSYVDTGTNSPTSYAKTITGLNLTGEAATPSNDITTAVGSAGDSTGVYFMKLASALTKQIDVIWAEGDADGGFPSTLGSIPGTPDDATWYRFFLIGKTDGTVDAGFDSDASATNLLADATGYTLFRRIGWIYYVDGTDGMQDFLQNEDRFSWDAWIIDRSHDTFSDTNDEDVTITAPPSSIAKCTVRGSEDSSEADKYIVLYPKNRTSTAAGAANYSLLLQPQVTTATATYLNNGIADTALEEVELDSSSVARIRTSGTGADVRASVVTMGWLDDRRA